MKKLILFVLSIFLIGAVFMGASKTFAQSDTNNSQTLIQRITEKFGLKEPDVQSVVDNFHQEKFQQMKTQRRSRLEEKLNSAVSSGKITEAQKQAILKKFDELQNEREAQTKDLENWAKNNGLDKLGMGMGLGRFKGFGRGMHFWK